MTSNRPYLIRAIHEWLIDNQCTPHLLVDAEAQGVEVPRQHVKDGKIVLNLGPNAVEALSIGNEEVSFMARFGFKVLLECVLCFFLRQIRDFL